MTNDQTSPLDTAIPLVGWGDFESLRSQIVGRTFGHMVRLAVPVVNEYHSDLYIDAMNLDAIMLGARNADNTVIEFDYVVRHSGTWFGMMAREAAKSNHGDRTLRHYVLRIEADDRQAWSITITDKTVPILDAATPMEMGAKALGLNPVTPTHLTADDLG